MSRRLKPGEAAAVFFGGRVPRAPRKARERCTLCHEAMPDLNRHGECVECVDHAESSWGF